MEEQFTGGPLISVIVPVFNAENYLRRCLDSILGQTYTNLEIILVDDGSTDQSGAICDEYYSRNSRIRLIHQENKGLGEARNAGIDIATGKLITFVDSDDWLELNAYELMTKCMEHYQCDIVTCGRFYQSDSSVRYDFCLEEGVLIRSREEFIKRFLLFDGLNMAAWDKLYKAELFENIRYPKGYLMCEDYVPAYQLLNKADSIYLCGQPLYHYYKHPGSITASGFNDRSMGPAIYGQQVSSLVRETHPGLKNEAVMFEVEALLYELEIIKNGRGSRKAKRAVRRQLKQIDFGENPYLSKGSKVFLRFIIYGLDVPYLKLYRFLSNHPAGKKLLKQFR